MQLATEQSATTPALGPKMTDAQWRQKNTALKAKVARLRNAAKAKETLAEKLSALELVKAAEREWDSHRLHYYSLVA